MKVLIFILPHAWHYVIVKVQFYRETLKNSIEFFIEMIYYEHGQNSYKIISMNFP